MTAPTANPSVAHEHELAWNDRLQDWLDGDLDAADALALQAHIADCAMCRARAEELQALDRSLRSAAPPLALDDAFDAKIFAQVDEMIATIDDSRRAAARQRIEQELQQNLQALARGWRHALLFIVPGVIAGVALAFALTWWLSDAGVMRALIVESAAEFGSGSSGQVQLIATTLVGAGLGGMLARWLASVLE
jgi:anti-sigma factor RsiW